MSWGAKRDSSKRKSISLRDRHREIESRWSYQKIGVNGCNKSWAQPRPCYRLQSKHRKNSTKLWASITTLPTLRISTISLRNNHRSKRSFKMRCLMKLMNWERLTSYSQGKSNKMTASLRMITEEKVQWWIWDSYQGFNNCKAFKNKSLKSSQKLRVRRASLVRTARRRPRSWPNPHRPRRRSMYQNQSNKPRTRQLSRKKPKLNPPQLHTLPPLAMSQTLGPPSASHSPRCSSSAPSPKPPVLAPTNSILARPTTKSSARENDWSTTTYANATQWRSSSHL